MRQAVKLPSVKRFALLGLSCFLAVQTIFVTSACENAAFACGPFFDQTVFFALNASGPAL